LYDEVVNRETSVMNAPRWCKGLSGVATVVLLEISPR
jgi:hypothetical protein